MANYTMRARLVERDLFPGQNVTLIGCWVEPIYSNNRTITLNAGRPNPPTNINATLNTTTGDIIIVWTPSNSSNVYDYVIYATDNYTQGFNFSDPYATVPNTSSNWTDFLANSTDERYYLIKANNTVGMEDRDYFVIGKFNLKMYTGWSLFSLPLKPWNQDINSIIYTGTQDDQMWRYDANDTGDHYKGTDFYEGFGWFGDSEMSYIYNGMGYWYYSHKGGYVTTPYNNTIVGVVPQADVTHTIYEGWNLLGWTSANEKDANTASTFPNATNLDQLWRYDSWDVSDRYKGSDYYEGYGWYGDFTNVEPGRGYWYYSQNVATYDWIYTP